VKGSKSLHPSGAPICPPQTPVAVQQPVTVAVPPVFVGSVTSGHSGSLVPGERVKQMVI
jgi:hypothetical protein